jgi:hypothetical protein
MTQFRCGHTKTPANTVVRTNYRGNHTTYETCRACRNQSQRRHQRRMRQTTGKSQWQRREKTK